MKQSNLDRVPLDRLLLGLVLDRDGTVPLHAQLATHLRRQVLSGTVTPGARLPSSRVLAEALSLSRATVVTAVDQIVSEGYAEGRRGAGLFVTADLPDPILRTAPRGGDDGPPHPALDSPRPDAPPPRPFRAGSPALDLFPHRAWARHLLDAWQAPGSALTGPADPLGYPPLRAAIATHLRDWRGLACGPDQVVVTAGLGDAIGLLAHAALAPGGTVLVEDPGHAPLWHALRSRWLVPRAMPVDTQGFDIAAAEVQAPHARAVVVTPSRHFPLGMTLPLSRRLALLDWARRTGGLIVEDDYDSELRYAGAPLPALASLDTGPQETGERGSVAYVGSFSKVMMPALRLGFLVVPGRLVEAVRIARRITGGSASLIPQPALARFMASGAFAAHIRRMRRLYGRRQRALLAALATHLDGRLTVTLPPAGMHVVADLAPALAARMSDEDAARRAAAAGVSVLPLSGFAAPDDLRLTPRPTPHRTREGLVLGYAAFDEAALERAAATLSTTLGSG